MDPLSSRVPVKEVATSAARMKSLESLDCPGHSDQLESARLQLAGLMPRPTSPLAKGLSAGPQTARLNLDDAARLLNFLRVEMKAQGHPFQLAHLGDGYRRPRTPRGP